MLTAHTPAQSAPPPRGPFTWQCDFCEAKEVTATPQPPADWTVQTVLHDQEVLCADCSNSSEWEL